MKKLLVAGIAAAAFCGAPALAADMPVKAPVYKAAPAPVFSWTGCYIGAEAGYGWGKTDHTFVVDLPALRGTSVDGGMAGGTLGCNYQTGAWVWGLENDFSWTGFSGSGTDISNPSFTIGTKMHWLDTLRGRVGYSAGPSLWYVTGGAAFGNITDFQHEQGGLLREQDITTTRTGWTVGGGVEWMIDPRWSWKIEYLYVHFSNHDYSYIPSLTSEHANLSENIVRVGLNYKFGSTDWGKAPVVAKY